MCLTISIENCFTELVRSIYLHVYRQTNFGWLSDKFQVRIYNTVILKTLSY